MLSRHKGQRCAASLGLTSLGHLSVLNLVVSLTTFYNASEERNGASLNFGSAALVPLTELTSQMLGATVQSWKISLSGLKVEIPLTVHGP